MKQGNYVRGVRLRPATVDGFTYWYAWSIHCRTDRGVRTCGMAGRHPLHAKTRHQLIEMVDRVLKGLNL